MGNSNSYADFIVSHPGQDVALVRSSSSFQMDGSTTGYSIPIYKGDPEDLEGEALSCKGYGMNSCTDANNDGTITSGECVGYGTLRAANLVVGPYDATTADQTLKLLVGNGGEALSWGDSGTSCQLVDGDGAQVAYIQNSGIGPNYGKSPSVFREWAIEQMYSLNFGASVVTGDFNEDGYIDLAIGNPSKTVGGTEDVGEVRVYSGSSSGWTYLKTLSQSSSQNEQNDHFGFELASGDFDGDGDDDLAVGTPGEVVSGAQSGAVWMFFSAGSSGLPSTPTSLISQTSPFSNGANEDGDKFGWALTTGNFNNDSYDDLVIGAPGEDLGTDSSGYVFVYMGGSSGFTSSFGLSQSPIDTNDNMDFFGYSLSSGDFDGDGKDDLAVGNPSEQVIAGVNKKSGEVFVFKGQASGTALTSWVGLTQGGSSTQDEYGDMFGYSLASGDFNADGKDDLAVGAPWEGTSGLTVRSGAVHLFQGSASGLTYRSMLTQAGQGANERGDYFGVSLAVGNFNGDTYSSRSVDDLVVGAPGEDWGSYEDGVVFVFSGSSVNFLTVTDSFAQDRGGFAIPENLDWFGGAGMAAGDFNNDGEDDLCVAATGEIVGTNPRGAAVVYKGVANDDMIGWAPINSL